MKLIKSLNHNAAVGIDDGGKEIVVIGKGVGFFKEPTILKNFTCVEKIFNNVNLEYYSLISSIDEKIILICSEIAELATKKLNTDLNPNLSFTLADHVSFASERLSKGVEISNPLDYDIKHLYKKEYEVAKEALEILKEKLQLDFPKSEIVCIALQIINSESGNEDQSFAINFMGAVSEIEKIIEEEFELKIDKESYFYSRFIMHMRYLVQRLSSGQQVERSSRLLRDVIKNHPSINKCAEKVNMKLEEIFDCSCNEEEYLYLMLHIDRLIDKIES